jgi:ribonuclease P protein component
MPGNTSTAADGTVPDDRKVYGLPRSARVLLRKDFSRIYSRGLRAGGEHIIVVALRRRDHGHRVGLSVSKIHGCAVVRNKVKRILREAFRLERPTLPGKYDIVLIPRQRPGKYDLQVVRAELRRLVQRVHSGKGRPRRAKKGSPR